MRFAAILASVSIISSVAGAYHPRQIPGFPACANDCLNKPSNLGGCAQTDETCLCKSLPFVQTTFACITAACQGADQQSAITGAENLCLNFGVTLAAESSAIMAGLSTIASGASITGAPSSTAPPPSSTPSPTGSTGSARHLTGGILGATVALGVAAALSF
ncbi:hypothetical protein DFH08DRAFT_829750 [Mycena albidolilacea]|uniref:CFEM domain-containing protein n=1 Tax=Mycena albidolilacea TaxID=1033008 RepID=A0AAD7F6N5_9AGAR|nr:hypothetical protein DFH08DRAFT_829750 [Mycena albidolilacea]